ncbi:uncharacterized protein LOC135497048 [Lineus longissimus]|uniref:uncharacterized protein LOC135497048 n=1 Tax=Lineus longissimus TaxID=88925 RepID=UPI00315C8885
MAMVMPGVPVRRGSKEDAMRRVRKNISSQVDKVKTTQWKMDDRKLEKELGMIEKDRMRMNRQLQREKFGLAMELREMKKEVAEVKNVKNESCVVVGDGSLVRLNRQRLRERRLSLPVNLVARPSSAAVSLLSDGSTSTTNIRLGSRRPSRPGTCVSRIVPLSTDDVIRNMELHNGQEESEDGQNGEMSDADDLELRRKFGSEYGRRRRASVGGEMTPSDVKLHFMRRNSMKDIGDFPRVQTPGAGPEFDFQTGPRSRLALRRKSMPDIQRARTAILLGTTPNLEPVGEIEDPVKDPRFRSLMGSLTNQFKDLDTRTQRPKMAAEDKSYAWPDTTATSAVIGLNRMDFRKKELRVTEIEPPHRTRRLSSAF